MGPVLNTVIGAAIKLGANLLNFWLEQRRQDQLMLAARDNDALQAMLKNQAEQAKDPFVKVTKKNFIFKHNVHHVFSYDFLCAKPPHNL